MFHFVKNIIGGNDMKNSKWEQFLKKGDIKSYMEYRKEQKNDSENSTIGEVNENRKNRRGNNKK